MYSMYHIPFFLRANTSPSEGCSVLCHLRSLRGCLTLPGRCCRYCFCVMRSCLSLRYFEVQFLWGSNDMNLDVLACFLPQVPESCLSLIYHSLLSPLPDHILSSPPLSGFREPSIDFVFIASTISKIPIWILEVALFS